MRETGQGKTMFMKKAYEEIIIKMEIYNEMIVIIEKEFSFVEC